MILREGFISCVELSLHATCERIVFAEIRELALSANAFELDESSLFEKKTRRV